MLRATISVAVFAMLVGCASIQIARVDRQNSPLLDGRELFGETVPPAEPAAILALSPDMRAFVESHTGHIAVEWIRLKRLMYAMVDEGLFNLDYESERTLTASQTFSASKGNCLSFTNLFVALARASKLDARYQVVDVPPIWDTADGWMMLNDHVDVVVKNVGMSAPGVPYSRDYVVDFNMPEYQPTYPHREVDDSTAFALFYNNRAVEAMRAGDTRRAFANFKLAIAQDANVASVWVNLGALYSRSGHHDFAEKAYQVALDIDPNQPSALTNLAHLYALTGQSQLAADYRQRVRRHEQANPYYHFSLAKAAYRDGNYADALDEVQRAINIKHDDHRFYYLQGLIHYRRNEVADARKSIEKAAQLIDDDFDKQRYENKLAALAAKDG